MQYLLISLLIAAVFSDCKFSTDTNKYDLSGLQKIMPVGGFKSSDNLSRMGMCDNNAHECKNEQGFMAVFGDSSLNSCVVMLARWDTNSPPTAAELPISDSPNGGLQLTFQSGDACPSVSTQKNYEVLVKLQCDETVESEDFLLKLDEPPCTFSATMKTKYACPGAGGGGSSSGGLSGGSIFLIILLVTFVVYLVGGIFYQKKYGDEEDGMIPNKDVWQKLYSFTRIGCVVSWNFTKEKASGLMSKGDKEEDEGDAGETEY